jgi:hypothetical protein
MGPHEKHPFLIVASNLRVVLVPSVFLSKKANRKLTTEKKRNKSNPLPQNESPKPPTQKEAAYLY